MSNITKIVDVQRRTGTPAFIKVDKSMNNPDRMFLSAPNISELTFDQSMELVAAILEASAGIWPEGDK
ncbi:hypothetical protein [Corynebacterium casei]|uniref:hypothetical protein n=1 Tax=Corynebacterium casei TaxID=160386 RepID=UPI003FD1BE50